MPSPDHLKIIGVDTSLKHTQKPSKLTQVHIDQILRFSTSFKSVSASLTLE